MIRPSLSSNGPRLSSLPPQTGAEERRAIVPEGCLCLVGQSETMRAVREQLRRVAAHFRMVLITGEAGTGKEIVARVMHRLSTQPETPFVSRSAASFLSLVPEMLAHPRGTARSSGRTMGQDAASGPEARATLFLGDVNALTSGEQIYLLDALTRLEELRPGGDRPRLIFATERDLQALTGAGQFEQKLYRKISAVEIALPALRSRPEDIAVIAGELMQTGRPQRLDTGVLARLEAYGWPGNVRELKRVLELAQMRAAGGVIELAHLPPLGGPAEVAMQRGAALVERLEDVIQSHVLEVLLRCAGNKVRAAERLGISRSTLYRTLENSTASLLDRAG
jgi:DNA-binding NtrC family response regulator